MSNTFVISYVLKEGKEFPVINKILDFIIEGEPFFKYKVLDILNVELNSDKNGVIITLKCEWYPAPVIIDGKERIVGYMTPLWFNTQASNKLDEKDLSREIEFKTYSEWLPILEEEKHCLVIDDDGGRRLINEGIKEALLTKEEVLLYFRCNTIMPVGAVINTKIRVD